MKFIYKNNKRFRNYLKNRKFVYRCLSDYKWLLSFVLIGFLLIGVGYFVPGGISGNIVAGFNYVKGEGGELDGQIVKIMDITFDNLPYYLENNNLVVDLPKDALINLGVGEFNYIVKKGNVDFGKSEIVDMQIWLPDIYLETLGERGLCGAIQEAKRNGDFWVDIYLGEFELGWKYKSMTKYNDCLF